MKTSAIWIGLAVVGWGAFGWAVCHRAENSPGIPGAGHQFQATTVRTNGGNYTAISRTANGEVVWAEWKFPKGDQNPDSVHFYYNAYPVAVVMKVPGGTVAGFEFTFLGADGQPRERWLARPESATWDELIKFSNRSVSERLAIINGKWEPVVMRGDERGIMANGAWAQLAYTNGTWTPLVRKE